MGVASVVRLTLATIISAFCLLPSALAQQPSTSADDFARAVFFGQKFFAMKDYTAAYQQFAKADQLQPDVAGVLYDMALTLAKAGRVSEAQTKVDRYNQLYPAGAEKPLVAKLQLELEFQRELQKKRQVEEEYAELFTRGRFLYQRGDLDAAMRLFQEAEQKRPNDPAAVFNQAVILEKRGDFAKAAERFHRYADLENDAPQKALADQRILTLESEIEDMKTKIVCSFCGLRLPIGATWCPRCWHGPYLTASPVWSSRACADGATATRTTFYADDRFAKNDTLPCLFAGSMRDALRYTPAKQKLIQDARKAEGWTYDGDILRARGDVKLVQGTDTLEKAVSANGGDILLYSAHKVGDVWLLDREDLVVEGQKYTVRTTFDAQSRIARQEVTYQNAAACNHLIGVVADYAYAGDALAGVKFKGGYDGYPTEGSPHVEWQAATAYAYDAGGRLTKEELAVTSFTKEYTQKPQGNERDEVASLYPSMRVRRPIQDVARSGDLCAKSGTLLVGNPIDLRPFYAMSPNLSMLLPFGVTKASVTFTYPAK
jgi:tetratricopeptide (TPR) repeat protein